MTYHDLVQWEFQDPKLEVLYHIRPYFVGIFPYIGLKNRPFFCGRYLQSIGSWNGHWLSETSWNNPAIAHWDPHVTRLIAEGHAIAAHDPGYRGFAPLLIRPERRSVQQCWETPTGSVISAGDFPRIHFYTHFDVFGPVSMVWNGAISCFVYHTYIWHYMTPKITFCWGQPLISGRKSIGIGIMFILVFDARGQALRPRRTRQFYHASSWYFPLPKRRCSHHPKWWCPDNLPGSPSGGYTEWYFEVWSWNGTNRRFLAKNISNVM